jgi:pilus assembly protein Flp/PilA
MRSVSAWLMNLLARAAWPDDRGATAVEYALIVAIIAVAVGVAIRALGLQVRVVFNDISSAVSNAL